MSFFNVEKKNWIHIFELLTRIMACFHEIFHGYVFWAEPTAVMDCTECRCSPQGRSFRADLTQCTSMAVEAGVNFFQYRTSKQRCRIPPNDGACIGHSKRRIRKNWAIYSITFGNFHSSWRIKAMTFLHFDDFSMAFQKFFLRCAIMGICVYLPLATKFASGNHNKSIEIVYRMQLVILSNMTIVFIFTWG